MSRLSLISTTIILAIVFGCSQPAEEPTIAKTDDSTRVPATSPTEIQDAQENNAELPKENPEQVRLIIVKDRIAMSPSELIVGEWKSATEAFAPNREYPNSREYISAIDTTNGTGTRSLRHEDGKVESSPYSVVREDKDKRILEISIHLSDGQKRKALFRFDETGTKATQQFYVTDTSHIDTHQLYVSSVVAPSSVRREEPKGSGKPYMVRVAVNDDTQRKPVHSRAEIWFRGHGSWWLKSELKFGGTVKNLGTRPSGEKQTLIIYPESRDGKELKVPYMMTDEMSPKGSPRDMISVDISDTEITVHGLPIKAATGEFELKYKR